MHPHVRKTPRWKKHKASLARPRPPLLVLPPAPGMALEGPVDLQLLEGSLLSGAEPLVELPTLDSAALRIGGEQRTLGLSALAGRAGLFFAFDRRRRVSGDAAFAFQALPRGGFLDSGKVLFSLPQDRRSRPEASPAITARFGTELEIVPLLDPLVLGPGAELPVRIRFRGPGLAGARLSAEVQALGARKSAGVTFSAESDASGMVLVPIRSAGLWVLRTEKADKGADGRALLFRSFLSFRVPGLAPRAATREAR